MTQASEDLNGVEVSLSYDCRDEVEDEWDICKTEIKTFDTSAILLLLETMSNNVLMK